MLIFHSYVKLPEVNVAGAHMLTMFRHFVDPEFRCFLRHSWRPQKNRRGYARTRTMSNIAIEHGPVKIVNFHYAIVM